MAKYKKGDIISINSINAKTKVRDIAVKLKVISINSSFYLLENLSDVIYNNAAKNQRFFLEIKYVDSSSVLLESTQPVKVIERRINVNFHNDTWIDKLYNSYCTWKGRFLEKDKKEIIIEEKIIENE